MGFYVLALLCFLSVLSFSHSSNEQKSCKKIICSKADEETRLLRVKVDEMETKIQNLTSQMTVMRCDGGMIHEKKCFWAEIHITYDTNYDKAQEICTNKGFKPANIYGKDHYEKIINYLRSKLNGREGFDVWTGMTKKHDNNIAQLSDGSPAPYTRQRSYRSRWDNADSSYTQVYLLVKSSTNDSDQGMGAYLPDGYLYGVLCQAE